MDEIYIEEFIACKFAYEDNRDVRNKALQEVNRFFDKHTGYKALNIIEEWSGDKSLLRLIVYYY